VINSNLGLISHR